MKHIFLGVAAGLVALGAQAQTFTNISSSLPGTYNSGNCVGFTDMDNDGLDDLVVLHLSKDLRVLYQQPDGSFSEVAYGAVSTANQWGMTVADFDNNGHKDVFCGGSYDGVHVKRIESIDKRCKCALARWKLIDPRRNNRVQRLRHMIEHDDVLIETKVEIRNRAVIFRCALKREFLGLEIAHTVETREADETAREIQNQSKHISLRETAIVQQKNYHNRHFQWM
jgi:hypothetical protein